MKKTKIKTLAIYSFVRVAFLKCVIILRLQGNFNKNATYF